MKRPLFDALSANAIGMTLTESLAMLPGASVSGFYLAHPEARYFAVGRIGQDQIDDFAGAGGLRARSGGARLLNRGRGSRQSQR